MNLAQQLHNAARRYCIENHSHWASMYSTLDGAGKTRIGLDYTREALRIIAKIRLLRAIRDALESIDPIELIDVNEVREFILMAREDGENALNLKHQESVFVEAAHEGLHDFDNFMESLSPRVIRTETPLPYRRILSETEGSQHQATVKKRWLVVNHDTEFIDLGPNGDILKVNSDEFEEQLPVEEIRSALQFRGVTRVFEVRQGGKTTEMDLCEFVPFYDGLEGYWTSSELDWIIAASHEGETFVGGWLRTLILG